MLPLVSSAAAVGTQRGGDVTLADGTKLIADQSRCQRTNQEPYPFY